VTNGVPRPDHGQHWQERVCQHCQAAWVGHTTEDPDWCPWCEQRLELEADMRRRQLLNPPWLHHDGGNPRYDTLTDDDKAVWDRTRGQTRNTDSVTSWVALLARAVRDGVIGAGEARTATRRVTET
jgi:hypothetical protein